MKLTAITDFLYKTFKKKEEKKEGMNDFQPKAVTEVPLLLSLSPSKVSKDAVI